MEQKKYNIIYADPPWTYRVYSSKGNGRSAASHYPVMELEAIKALPVEQLAEKDCTLFLWVTFPNLRESFEVIESWGFTFKTVAFVWIKRNRKSDSLFWGMGYWTRANAEICLLATKGAPKRQSAGVHQKSIKKSISAYFQSFAGTQQKTGRSQGTHCGAAGGSAPD